MVGVEVSWNSADLETLSGWEVLWLEGNCPGLGMEPLALTLLVLGADTPFHNKLAWYGG